MTDNDLTTEYGIDRPTDELMLDLFTTALEGGISYWTEGVHTYHWENPDQTPDYQGFRAVIQHQWWNDGVSLSKSVVHSNDGRVQIDRSVVARGWRLARSREWRNKISWSSEKPPIVYDADEGWDFDAGDADIVVQLGLFGDVVYG